MSEKIRVLLDEETVEKRICEVAAQISEEYKGKEIHMICVLKGGVFFMCELAKRITVPVTLDFMSVSSYGDDTNQAELSRSSRIWISLLKIKKFLLWRILLIPEEP